MKKPAKPIFDEQWIQATKKSLQERDDPNSAGFGGSINRLGKLMLSFYCLAVIAVTHCSPTVKKKVLAEAEGVYNRFGVTIIHDEEFIKKCLAPHQECTGEYENPTVGKRMPCKCKCHTKSQ